MYFFSLWGHDVLDLIMALGFVCNVWVIICPKLMGEKIVRKVFGPK
jgi:hypothetical protein